MGHITSAKAYSNNEVGFLAWMLDTTIPGCLGFEVTRIHVDTGEERVIAAWVPFKGQSNPKWLPQNTSVWPVQKLTWRDLTLRKRSDKATLRPTDMRIKYRIRPLVAAKPGLQPVKNIPEKTYEGDPLPLAYADKGKLTNEIFVTSKYGNITSAFTNGILSAQWLKHALEEIGETESIQVVNRHISTPGDKFRQYLTGDVLSTLKSLLERAGKEPGAEVLLALYELSDKELIDTLLAHKDQINVILSNSGKDDQGAWDATDRDARLALKKAGVKMTNRMFNNGHIGHNKFAVLIGANGKPKAVMTGSTNWTSTGLCGQSNNAIILESPDVAADYKGYWERLLDDTKSFEAPEPLSVGSSNKQGQGIRTANAKEPAVRVLKDGTKISTWYSPNTKATTKGKDLPPDLSAVYSLMRKAEKAILFAVFLPSQSGKTSIIEEAISLGTKDPSLLVYGAVSDPTAMPNYVPPPKKTDGGTGGNGEQKKTPAPSVYDKGKIHIVRAAALTKSDIVGQFETELLKVGHAIIHDKIIVVDPLSKNGFVAMGSHNLGYKASYENDENLVIIQGNQKLIQAYAVHVLDVWDHYRFRALQQEMHDKGKSGFEGFLSRDSNWLDYYLSSDAGALARYFSS